MMNDTMIHSNRKPYDLFLYLFWIRAIAALSSPTLKSANVCFSFKSNDSPKVTSVFSKRESLYCPPTSESIEFLLGFTTDVNQLTK